MLLNFDLLNNLVIHPYTGVDDPRLKKNLKTISENFTIKREKIENYLETDEMVSAYTLFYFPTGFVKLRWVFERLPKDLVDSFRACEFVDVGAGPGTFSSAFLDYFEGEGSVRLIETSPSMLKQAKKSVTQLFPKAIIDGKNDQKKILFFGNSFNEMGLEKARSYIKKYNPETIILIEPGTKDVFREVLPLREELLQAGFHLAYPCPKESRCPMQGTDNWCHQVMQTTHDHSIEQLSQILQKDRRSMPMVAHVYTRSSITSVASHRVVRILPETKFSYEFELCHEGKISRFESMKKQYSKKSFVESLSFGDGLDVEVEKILNDGKIRGKIK